jgi:hypothetical protein
LQRLLVASTYYLSTAPSLSWTAVSTAKTADHDKEGAVGKQYVDATS